MGGGQPEVAGPLARPRSSSPALRRSGRAQSTHPASTPSSSATTAQTQTCVSSQSMVDLLDDGDLDAAGERAGGWGGGLAAPTGGEAVGGHAARREGVAHRRRALVRQLLGGEQ